MFTSAPMGMRLSGNAFVRAVFRVMNHAGLEPTQLSAYIDDLCLYGAEFNR